MLRLHFEFCALITFFTFLFRQNPMREIKLYKQKRSRNQQPAPKNKESMILEKKDQKKKKRNDQTLPHIFSKTMRGAFFAQ